MVLFLGMQIGRRKTYFYGIIFFLTISLFAGIMWVDYLDERELAAAPGQPETAPDGTVTIVIKVWGRVLEVHNNGVLYKKYRIAVGRRSTPTPVGEWNVVSKAYNPGTVFGTRWLGLNVPWGIYGIHGTDNPWSVGYYASQGCIRMRNKDIEQLFEWVPVGTPVKIDGPKAKLDRVLKYQTAGQDVVILQLKLKELGFFKSRADGMFGSATEQAVKDFQQAKGLKPTGVVDAATMGKLGI